MECKMQKFEIRQILTKLLTKFFIVYFAYYLRDHLKFSFRFQRNMNYQTRAFIKSHPNPHQTKG